MQIKRPDLLYEQVVEVNERIILVKEHMTEKYNKSDVLIGKSHEMLVVEKKLDLEEVEKHLHMILNTGIKSLAVVFLHRYYCFSYSILFSVVLFTLILKI